MIDIKEGLGGKEPGWIDDSERTLVAGAPPSLSRRNLLALRGGALDARRKALLAEECIALLELQLQSSDHGIQLVHTMAQLGRFEFGGKQSDLHLLGGCHGKLLRDC